VAKIGSVKSNQQLAEEYRAERYQKPQETSWDFLSNLKNGLF
jgi:hypothetical protein